MQNVAVFLIFLLAPYAARVWISHASLNAIPKMAAIDYLAKTKKKSSSTIN
jgi:hypothetical protein